MSYRATVTNHQIALFLDGETHTISSDSKVFVPLSKAIKEKADVEDIRALLDPKRMIEVVSKGRLVARGDVVYDKVKGRDLPKAVADRLQQAISAGKDTEPVFRFWERLSQNPSHRSIEGCLTFLDHLGIPITSDGRFLAYKSVRKDLKDHHTGTFENSPGKVLVIDRSLVSDDPRTACHEGFHVGSLQYASSFGDADRRLVICRVDPKNVVCVPYDSSAQKMRVCEYEVVGFYSGQMVSDIISSDDVPEPEVTVVVASKEEEKEAPKYVGLGAAAVSSTKIREILAMDMDELRRFARQDLKIVGANKMDGGKAALLEVVLSNLNRRR